MRPLSEYSAPTLFVLAFAAVLGVALVVAASTSTTAFGAYNSAWDGTAELRSVADSTGADSQLVTNTSAYSDHSPATTIALILAPDQPYRDQETARIGQFVRQGGTLVVADERPTQTNTFLTALGADARIDGQPLRDTHHYYRSPAAPIVRNVSAHPVTANVSAFTLNHGTAVTPHSATVLARTSGYAYLDTNGNEEPDQTERLTNYPIITVEQVGEGQVIVVGDPSLFINTMLDRTDNRQFVHNLFGAHKQVLLDYSHTASIPPLMQVVLAVRHSSLLQFLCGLGGVLAIAFLVTQPNSFPLVRKHLRALYQWPWATRSTSDRESNTGEPAAPVTDDDLVEHLRTQYPKWNNERLQRIVAARRQPSERLNQPEQPPTHRFE